MDFGFFFRAGFVNQAALGTMAVGLCHRHTVYPPIADWWNWKCLAAERRSHDKDKDKL